MERREYLGLMKDLSERMVYVLRDAGVPVDIIKEYSALIADKLKGIDLKRNLKEYEGGLMI